MQEKNCCVIGYCVIPADKLDDVKRELEREFSAALEDGYRKFLTSFTEGAGMPRRRLVRRTPRLTADGGHLPGLRLAVLLRGRIKKRRGKAKS